MQPFSLDFYLPSEEVAISAANYNYNHYNLPFSHIMIIVIISDEDMLLQNKEINTQNPFDIAWEEKT